MAPLPPTPTILFAHPAYQLLPEFERRGLSGRALAARDAESLAAALPQADVLVVSGMWRDALLERAPRLRFIQSVSAGTDQYGRDALRARGVRLASAQGANERAVSEHAMALILALARQLHLARDNQHARRWRPMIGDPARREAELAGRTLLVVGMGRIGSRLARLAAAFDMRVLATRRSVEGVHVPEGVTLRSQSELLALLPEADIVALCCPLTPETAGMIGGAAFAAMKPGAILVNVARGRVVDEPALIAAIAEGRLGAAGLDCTAEEPLPPLSPLWTFPNVLITPHSAGETGRYEANVIDLLAENLGRLGRGEALRNGIV